MTSCAMVEGMHLQVRGLEIGIKENHLTHMLVKQTNSVHNQCAKKCEDLMTQKQSIQTTLDKQYEEVKSEYQVRLNASIEVIRQLLKGALSFRGHDESESSIRRGHF